MSKYQQCPSCGKIQKWRVVCICTEEEKQEAKKLKRERYDLVKRIKEIEDILPYLKEAAPT